MATVRDEVEAYNFAARRQVLALLQGDETVPVDPRRRLNRSTVGGLLVGVLAVAVVGVAGYFAGSSSTSVPKNGVIVNSATGGAYVIVDKVLHPALNMASAKLLAGSQVTTVSGSALAKLPRGLPVGIPNAPDSLPPTSALSRGAWSACSIAPEASDARGQVVLSVGGKVPTPLGPADGLAVRSPDGRTWLLQNGMRYAVSPAASTLLGLDRVAPVPITAQVLDLVPEGPPLAVPAVARAGAAPTRALPFKALVGDLVEVDFGNGQVGRYVVLDDGVAPVDPFTFELLAGAAHTTLHLPARDIVSVASRSRAPTPPLWPRDALNLAAPPAAGEPLCITYDPSAPRTAAAWPVTISKPAVIPLPPGGAVVSAKNGSLAAAATGVAVPPGGGVLALGAGTGGVDSVFELVTDSGLRFAVADAQAVSRLGYSAESAVSVPLPFVDLLPAGPALDPAAAGAEYAGTAPPPTGGK